MITICSMKQSEYPIPISIPIHIPFHQNHDFLLSRFCGFDSGDWFLGHDVMTCYIVNSTPKELHGFIMYG